MQGPGRRAAICAWLCVCAATVIAQDVTESSLKAAFVHNFIKFTSWPPAILPRSAPLVACVVGDEAFAGVLGKYVRGQPVDGHDIVVQTIAFGAPLRSCHLVYVSGLTGSRAAEVAASLNGSPVLTLSDIDQFAHGGGMVQFYSDQGGLRFRVNLVNTKRSGLQLGSQLLSLATIIK